MQLFRLSFILVFIFCSGAICAQQKTTHRIGAAKRRPVLTEAESRTDCICVRDLDHIDTTKRPPFYKAVHVYAISYVDFMTAGYLIEHPEYNASLHSYSSYAFADTLGYKYVKEIVELSTKQVDSLASLCFFMKPYNYKHTRVITTYGDPNCYNPRNAFVFTDTENKVIGYLELCFECRGHRAKPEELLGEMCGNKYQLYKNFFVWVGITYGVTDEPKH